MDLQPGLTLPRSTSQPATGITRRDQWGKYFAYRHSFAPLAANAVGARDSLQLDGDSDFLLHAIAVLADNRGAKVRLELSPLAETFNFVPAFLSNLGTGRFPLLLTPPLVLPRNAIFTAVMDDRQLVGANDTILLAYHGAKVYRQPLVSARRYARAKPYGYVANFTANDGGPGAIAAGSTQIFTLRADGDSDFEVQKITVVSDGPCTVQIQSDNDNWFVAALRSELLGGSNIETTAGTFSGERPFILPAPRLITGAGYITSTVANLDAVNANRVQVTYWGVRLYPAGGLRV